MDGILESGAGRNAQRIMIVGMSAGAVVGAVIVVGLHLAAGPGHKADLDYWRVSGPPCPEVGLPQIEAMTRPLAQVSDFGEGRFARVSGAIECTDVADSYGVVQDTVCQFNRPRALAVWSKGGVRYFDLAGGEPATVTASDRQPPRCVMASNYKGD
jgi:hypothetical protein